ncbi:hypothetical protein B296_00016453, partial [Ensete ventricosum]
AWEKPKAKHRKGLWSPDEDQRLREHILEHGHGCWSSVPAKAVINSFCFFRFASKWKELQVEVDQLPEARTKAWCFLSRGRGNSDETSCHFGQQVSIQLVNRVPVSVMSFSVSTFNVLHSCKDLRSICSKRFR